MIWPQCAVHNAKHTRIFLHRGIFFSFSLVLSLLHTTTTGYVQRQDKVSHWLPQWEIFEVKYCFFFIKSWWKEMKGHCIELNCFTWCKTISHKLGICIKILKLSISSETMLWSGFNSGISNFPKQSEPIELLFYPLCMPLKQLCLVSHFLLHFFVSKQTSFLLCSSPRRYFNVLTPHGVKSQSPIIYLSVNSWNEQQHHTFST